MTTSDQKRQAGTLKERIGLLLEGYSAKFGIYEFEMPEFTRELFAIVDSYTAEQEAERKRLADAIEVRKCPHGRGVFAKHRIRKGESLGVMFGVGYIEFPIPELPDSEMAFTNYIDHSSMPNTAFIIDPVRKMTAYVATEEIRQGSELFIDYRSYYYGNRAFYALESSSEKRIEGGTE